MQRDGARRADVLRRCLALTVMDLEPGARVPTIRDLAKDCGASVGATQMALSRLEHDSAIVIERRGRYGTFLQQRALGPLWSAAEGRPLVLSLPLPSTLRIQGLATAIKAAISAAGIDVFLVFLRGSRQRMATLRLHQCDAVVMSSLAAVELAGNGTCVAVELSPSSFVREHRVYYVPSGRVGGRLRVGIDRDSIDFERLTELEFGDVDAEFMPGPYMHAVALMRDRRLDAAVGDVEEAFVRFPSFVRDRRLSDKVREVIGDRNTRAAFVCRTDDVATHVVLKDSLDDASIAVTQAEVLAGQRVPEY